MQPGNARDFLKAALQRLSTAEAIFERLQINLEAQYLAGYAVECAFKALILEKTRESDRPETLSRLTRGAASHRPEVLIGRLRDLEVSLTPELSGRMRRFDWSSDLRYESGRLDTGETRAVLKTANMICDWVKEQLP